MRDRRDVDQPPANIEDDPTKATEEAEPYFPPTDPVIEPGPRPRVVGGFEADAMTGDAVRPPRATTGGSADEGVADRVRSELRQDAATAGLDLEVSVEDATVTLRGDVQDLADVDNALAVAGRVAGVSDVIDELEVAGT